MRHGSDPVRTLAERFGGQTALGKLVGARQSVVAGWIARRTVPSKRIPQIIAAAARLDPPVHLRPDDFFDLPTPAPSVAEGEGART